MAPRTLRLFAIVLVLRATFRPDGMEYDPVLVPVTLAGAVAAW
jgi:hypothetical protein